MAQRFRKQTWIIISRLLKSAFSGKYLLATNITLSASLSAAADVTIQRRYGPVGRKSDDPRLENSGHCTASPVYYSKPQKTTNDNLSDITNARASTSDAQLIDKYRLRNMTIMGVVGGFLGHYWYIWLDSRRLSGSTLTIVIKKTLIDQIVLSPVGIAIFFFGLGYLDGNTTRSILSEIRRKAPGLLLFDWLVYPPTQFINFMFLPTRYRVLYDSLVAYGVDLYYCHTKFER